MTQINIISNNHNSENKHFIHNQMEYQLKWDFSIRFTWSEWNECMKFEANIVSYVYHIIAFMIKNLHSL